jgi:hypothetical protein
MGNLTMAWWSGIHFALPRTRSATALLREQGQALEFQKRNPLLHERTFATGACDGLAEVGDCQPIGFGVPLTCQPF